MVSRLHRFTLFPYTTLFRSLWAERTAAELARIPGRVSADDELTATERQVAKLVASGLSNKEVAAKDRKSTRLNSSHLVISYAVFCLKKKTREGATRRDSGRG